jgi:rod shape-determining protein MreC
VIGRTPILWYATVNVSKGAKDGVRRDQAVVSGDGLIGRVTEVTSSSAQVTLITDHKSAVSAQVAVSGVRGIISAPGGNPRDLLFDFITSGTEVTKGQRVVTAGSRSDRLESLFPPDLPIGTISRVEPDELELYQRVHIKPYADLSRLEFVQILTKHHASTEQAQVQQ